MVIWAENGSLYFDFIKNLEKISHNERKLINQLLFGEFVYKIYK